MKWFGGFAPFETRGWPGCAGQRRRRRRHCPESALRRGHPQLRPRPRPRPQRSACSSSQAQPPQCPWRAPLRRPCALMKRRPKASVPKSSTDMLQACSAQGGLRPRCSPPYPARPRLVGGSLSLPPHLPPNRCRLPPIHKSTASDRPLLPSSSPSAFQLLQTKSTLCTL